MNHVEKCMYLHENVHQALSIKFVTLLNSSITNTIYRQKRGTPRISRQGNDIKREMHKHTWALSYRDTLCKTIETCRCFLRKYRNKIYRAWQH